MEAFLFSKEQKINFKSAKKKNNQVGTNLTGRLEYIKEIYFLFLALTEISNCTDTSQNL
jgi:hypothetical protein